MDSEKDLTNGKPDGYFNLLKNILDKTISQTEHLDSQINILIGINSAIFLYSASKIEMNSSPVFISLGIFSAVSLLLGLIGIHPPHLFRKKNDIQSKNKILKLSEIQKFSSAKAYSDELIEVFGRREIIAQNYADQIYDMAKYYYRPKRKLYKWSRNILLAGLAIAVLLFLLSI